MSFLEGCEYLSDAVSWVRCLEERCQGKCGYEFQFGENKCCTQKLEVVKLRASLTFASGDKWCALTCALEDGPGRI